MKNETELKKYEIDKKYEISQNMAEKKLKMSSDVFVGNENLANISLLADKFSKAGNMVPKEFQGQPDKCFAAIYKGASLGLDAFTSLQRIAVINGRATIWGDTALALVRKSGLMTKFKEEIFEENGKLIARCTVQRIYAHDESITEFSQEDAVKAGLWNQNTWAKYPKRMLKYRARAFALRDMFSDVLDGLHLKEEMEGEQIIKDATPNTGNYYQNQLKELTKEKETTEKSPVVDVTQKIPPQKELEKQNDLQDTFFNLVKNNLEDKEINLKDKKNFWHDKKIQIDQLPEDKQQALEKLFLNLT